VLCCWLRPAERAHFPSHAPSMLVWVGLAEWGSKSTFALQDSESHSLHWAVKLGPAAMSVSMSGFPESRHGTGTKNEGRAKVAAEEG
jgi:hypothetical protein